jgi:hypothetical protein
MDRIKLSELDDDRIAAVMSHDKHISQDGIDLFDLTDNHDVGAEDINWLVSQLFRTGCANPNS